MKRREYIRIEFDFGDLDQMNRFSGDGWRVAAVLPKNGFEYWALLERVLPEPVIKRGVPPLVNIS